MTGGRMPFSPNAFMTRTVTFIVSTPGVMTSPERTVCYGIWGQPRRIYRGTSVRFSGTSSRPAPAPNSEMHSIAFLVEMASS